QTSGKRAPMAANGMPDQKKLGKKRTPWSAYSAASAKAKFLCDHARWRDDRIKQFIPWTLKPGFNLYSTARSLCHSAGKAKRLQMNRLRLPPQKEELPSVNFFKMKNQTKCLSPQLFPIDYSEKEARIEAPAAPATSHGLMETSDGPLEAIHGLPTTSRPSNAVPPGTGEQGPGEVGITPESCQGHLTPPGTSAPVAQLIDPVISEANSGTSGRPAAGLRKRKAAPAPTLPPKSRRTDTNAGEDMDVERGPRIPPIILDVPKGWASHAFTIKQLVGGDLEAICTARTLRLKTSTEQELKFHTFAMTTERLLKVVIKGLPATLSPEEVVEAFQGDRYSRYVTPGSKAPQRGRQLRKTFLSITQSGATHTAAAAAVTQRGESAAAVGGARVTQRGVSQRYLSYAQSGSLVCGRSGAARNKTR
ncbi:hypothetical protein J6590_106593, partial [Homalodisca vitripennis]